MCASRERRAESAIYYRAARQTDKQPLRSNWRVRVHLSSHSVGARRVVAQHPPTRVARVCKTRTRARALVRARARARVETRVRLRAPAAAANIWVHGSYLNARKPSGPLTSFRGQPQTDAIFGAICWLRATQVAARLSLSQPLSQQRLAADKPLRLADNERLSVGLSDSRAARGRRAQ